MGWFGVYLKKRIIFVFLLGISSGFPLALTGATLGYWMAENEVDIKTIGFFALVGSAYSLKFLWAPLIDKLHLPLFCNFLGRRKGWMLFIQLLLVASIVLLGFTNPSVNPWYTALFAVFVAFMSASQDIVIDAYRVEILDAEEQGAGAAAVTFGYRIGMLVSGAGALLLSGYGFSWTEVYVLISLTTILGMIVALVGPRPEIEKKITTKKNFADWFTDAVINPFRSFAGQKGWWVFLLFIVFFKLGDAMMSGQIMGAYYKELGFDKFTLAEITKGFGLVATIVGAFVGGALVSKFGIIKTLWAGAFLQASTNLMFALLYAVGDQNVPLLALSIGLDNFSGGIGTTAFVAFISHLCNLQYTATQYALLSSLSAIGRTTFSATGGVIIASVGWINFFILTTLAAAPGILLLLVVTKYFTKPVDSGHPTG